LLPWTALTAVLPARGEAKLLGSVQSWSDVVRAADLLNSLARL